MTIQEAREFVIGYSDQDQIDDDDLTEAFIAIYGRQPDHDDREQSLWSHLCAAVL